MKRNVDRYSFLPLLDMSLSGKLLGELLITSYNYFQIAIFNTALSVQNFKAAMAVPAALGLDPTVANSGTHALYYYRMCLEISPGTWCSKPQHFNINIPTTII